MDLKEIGKRVARERSHAGLTQRELAARAELSQPTLNRIEAGERSALTAAELDRLALALDVSLTRLTRANPVQQRIKVAARAGGEAAEALRIATRRAEEILSLDERMDSFALSPEQHGEHHGVAEVATLSCTPPSESLPSEDRGRLLAGAVREKLHLGLGPVPDPAELAESSIRVDTATLALPEGVSGFTARDPGRDVTLILINSADVPERQHFTLAHELGHVLFGDGEDAHVLDGTRTQAEIRCDAFARHLLAPEQGVACWMRENSAGPPGLKECAMAARHYGVSLMVVLIQCRRLGLLTAEGMQTMEGYTGRRLAWSFGWGPQYAAACDAASRTRPPRRILERAIGAYRAGRIGVRAVAALQDEDPRATERELTEAGITPPQPAAPRRVDVASLIQRRARKAEQPGSQNADGETQG